MDIIKHKRKIKTSTTHRFAITLIHKNKKSKKKEKNGRATMTTSFQQRVYTLCKKVPRGKVTTYKEIGNALAGKGQIYRAVGVALNKNPFVSEMLSISEHDRKSKKISDTPVVPCHRVVASDGRIGGFAHGIKKKIEMLRKEGIIVRNGRIVDFEKKLFRFL